jgi:hypothetical protein
MSKPDTTAPKISQQQAFLDAQQKQAKQRMGEAIEQLKSHAAQAMDPRPLTRSHPLPAVGAAVAIGLAAGLLTPGLLRSRPQPVVVPAANGHGAHAAVAAPVTTGPAGSGGVVLHLLRSLFEMLKPAVVAAISSAAAGHAASASAQQAAEHTAAHTAERASDKVAREASGQRVGGTGAA